eukprot:tig00021518_g22024.t1
MARRHRTPISIVLCLLFIAAAAQTATCQAVTINPPPAPWLRPWRLSLTPTSFSIRYGSPAGFQGGAADVPRTDTNTLLLFPSRSGALANETVGRFGNTGNYHSASGLQPGTQYTIHVVFTNAGGASAASLQFTTPLTLDPPPFTTLGCFNTTPAYDDLRVSVSPSTCTTPELAELQAKGYRYFGDGRTAAGSPVCLASNALDALTASGPLAFAVTHSLHRPRATILPRL